ncbi:uncharacterized protein LOC122510475 [Leptopilina heterotoma]|uniref:uncharacterized protein LOC122510475 n=1 Tax=Leptopilina heterotoma TaxID=63436 RepID=UPI001CA96B08|nr:uncharacterized protein LOC122510475 [Leptopilina heterotoma]
MDYRSKFLTGLGLILLLLVGKISIITENNVEEKEIKFDTLESDICSLYDNLSVIDYVLFEREYNPLVVIIAEKFIDGVNRVMNLSESLRILNVYDPRRIPYNRQLHEMILENIYLFEVNDSYYFVYPLNIQDHFLTIYSQKKLLKDNLDITFDFVNVNKEYSVFEDIFIPLQPSCTNCPLVKYINEKLEKGESFAELFELRKQLFREKETKNLSFAFNNDICTSMGFNVNSQSASSFLHFNTLLKQIQSNSKSLETKKRRTVERSLICIQSRHPEVEDVIFKNNSKLITLKNLMIMIDYLNWVNDTISSLYINDTSYGGLCENEHKIETLDLFCFMKETSDVTSHNITAWIEVLKELVAKSVISKLKWFNDLIFLYTTEYIIRNNSISFALDYLKEGMLNVTKSWSKVMTAAYNLIVENSLTVNNNNYEPIDNTICTIYEHWKTIDDLLLEVKFKKLVIIVTDDMTTGIKTVHQIRATRVEPKLRREDLHYSEQFLYDVIMKHIYLVQSNDTYYYIYPTTTKRQENSLIGYLEYKMIRDYSKVVYYFINFSNYFNEPNSLHYIDLAIPALPVYCDIISKNCKTRYISPSYLLKVHQEFFHRFPEHFHLYASFYNNFLEFANNYDQHYKGNINITYFLEFRNFLKQEISFDVNYLFTDLPCLPSRKLNRRTDIDFSLTKLVDVFYIYNLFYFSNKEIMLINDDDNTNLESLCSKKNILKFLKFFCFLKINYVDGILRDIDQKSYYIYQMENVVKNNKNFNIKYLSETIKWIEKLFSLNYIQFKYNESRIYKLSNSLYSQIPKITSNGADVSNKIYSIIKNNTIFLKCKKLL